VILVYDYSDKSSLKRLSKWASEVATDGSFVAPFPDETAARWVGLLGLTAVSALARVVRGVAALAVVALVVKKEREAAGW